uniref:Uncharacterized protein n=1 Tax=Peronospora matthiolae TaxID=2874970 RepID=A0AAV1UVB4_9STRA
MKDPQLPLVRSANRAHDAWSRLEGHFEKKSLANNLFLRRCFFTAKMEEGDDVLKHINKIKTLTEQLDAVSAPGSEDDLVITLLASRSDSYEFLITALESRADLLSRELIMSRLLHEDLKRKEQGLEGAVNGQGQSFVNQDSGRRTGRQAPAKTSSAFHYCGEHGNSIFTCTARMRGNAKRHQSQRANLAQRNDNQGDYLTRLMI